MITIGLFNKTGTKITRVLKTRRKETRIVSMTMLLERVEAARHSKLSDKEEMIY